MYDSNSKSLVMLEAFSAQPENALSTGTRYYPNKPKMTHNNLISVIPVLLQRRLSVIIALLQQ